MDIERVLAIETSCDDTSVSIVNRDRFVEGLLSSSQDLAHSPFGGVVPELASRNHSDALLPLINKLFAETGRSWSDVDGIAVTNRPGLIGSLLVGLVTAKTLAWAHKKRFIGINHIEGHIWAPFLGDQHLQSPKLTFPFLSLAVSGGHTQLILVNSLGNYEILGETVDDAAGEAFDKFAKIIGLGYPGGVQVDLAARKGSRMSYSFPRPLIKENTLNFSFSGLKTSALNLISGLSWDAIKQETDNLCASYQEAIVDVLITRLEQGLQRTQVKCVCITGGVSANSRLRERALEVFKGSGVEVLIPPLRYCTDNAAMIGLAGLLRLQKGETSPLDLAPSASSLGEDFSRAN